MELQATDEMVGQIIRAIVRHEVEAALERRGEKSAVREAVGVNGESLMPGVDPYALVPFAERVLGEAGGGPLHVRVIAEQMYRLGFRHRRPPKYRDQLERSLNSLASPSQHPDIFERVGPRTLRLR